MSKATQLLTILTHDALKVKFYSEWRELPLSQVFPVPQWKETSLKPVFQTDPFHSGSQQSPTSKDLSWIREMSFKNDKRATVKQKVRKTTCRHTSVQKEYPKVEGLENGSLGTTPPHPCKVFMNPQWRDAYPTVKTRGTQFCLFVLFWN